MIALLLAAHCEIEAIVYKTFTSSPQALVRVDYYTEECGTERPRIESETAVIHDREIYEGETPECWEVPEPRTGPENPCENGCPCLSFMAWVRGQPGEHLVQIYSAEGDGYTALSVTLKPWKPDVRRSKMGGR